jgi:hypothetical protein
VLTGEADSSHSNGEYNFFPHRGQYLKFGSLCLYHSCSFSGWQEISSFIDYHQLSSSSSEQLASQLSQSG